MKKKMIYILNSYSSKSAQHFYHVINLLSEISKNGVDVVLIIEKADEEPAIDAGITVVVQKEHGVKRAIELFKLVRKYINEGYNKTFVRISLNASVVAILASLGKKSEVYFWQSGDNLTYDRQKKGLDKIHWYLTNYSKLWFTKTFGDHFVTGPETMVKYYEDELHVAHKKMVCLYNDIDTNRFVEGTSEDKIKLRKELNISEDAKIVLFIHRLTPVKRFSNFIPAIAETEEARKNNVYYVAIGGGPEEELVKKNVNDSPYNDRIILLGARPNSEVQKFYAGSDVFVNPSYSEGFPRVVIEAMSAGLPVIVTDVGGTRDILPEEQKEYLLDKDDVNGFREKVIELVTSTDRCQKLSKINKKHVGKYSTVSVAKQYIEEIWKE